MKKAFLFATSLAVGFFTATGSFQTAHKTEQDISPPVIKTSKESYKEITGVIKPGETFFDIFKRLSLDIRDLFLMKEASANIHRLRNITANRPYKLMVDEKNRVQSFNYSINDDLSLNIVRDERGFTAEKVEVAYERRTGQIGGVINDSLISSIGEGRERLSLALNLSDIFAWDIDFSTELRNGDTFKLIVEELYHENEFKRYGDVIAAEFVNNGKSYRAYRFEHNGKAGYYDDEGNTLKRAFLKAPLNFRRISSGFSTGRFHPVLKRYRPHHGIDYAAPAGTPVSAVGDGTVTFSGYKGDYGKLVMIKHPNAYKTYYGHLSRIGKGVAPGVKVGQGEVIGYVGATGLATGPHLHYEMRVNETPFNPLRLKIPSGEPIPKALMVEFEELKDQMSESLASIAPSIITAKNNETRNSL
ncbi:MAG: peptidoglycan DD-metalloendopeptidase family protein [Deltaproteobacteria bacterium]|nr:peptidoglycan DD-metalloendopeptidase family protein [Deltaproteobacteria bacterium]